MNLEVNKSIAISNGDLCAIMDIDSFLPCISYTAPPPDSTVRGEIDVLIESCIIESFVRVSIPVELDTGPGPGDAGPLAYIIFRSSLLSIAWILSGLEDRGPWPRLRRR